MPTIITHAVVGLSAAAVAGEKDHRLKWLGLSAFCAILPDADVIGFKFGVAYADFLGHRGFFHSIFFASLVGLLVATLFFRDDGIGSRPWWGRALFFSLVTASHGILDAFTNGGLGIALLSPFDNARLFFPERPILVSPFSPRQFLSLKGLNIIKSELLWVWFPVISVTLGFRAVVARSKATFGESK